MKNVILFVVSFVFIYSCTNKNREFITILESITTDSMYLPIPDKAYSRAIGEQVTNIDSDSVLVCILHKDAHNFDGVYFIDLKTKKNINTISISSKMSLDAQLLDFLYINKDSILFMYNKFNKDSTFILTNFKGDIKKIYNIDNPYFKNGDSSLWVQQPFIYYDNKLFFTTSRKQAAIGTKEFFEDKYPIIGYLDLIKDTIILNNQLWFQNISKGRYYPWQATIVGYTISHKGILISFANTSILKEWDYKNNKINTYNVKSQLVDTILPEPKVYYGQLSKTQPYYSGVWYDCKQKMYIRNIWFPKNEYGKFRHLTVLFDTTYKYIGETNNFYYINDYNKISDGWSHGKSEYSDSIKLVKHKHIFGRLNIEKLRNEMEQAKQSVNKQKEDKFCSIMGSDYKFEGYTEKLMIDYTKKMFGIKDSTSFTLFVITDKDCGGCDEYVLGFINANNAAINATGACLLFAGDNTTYFNRLIDENNLLNINNLRIDTTGIYTDLHHFSQYNPRLVLCRDNKIVKDTIYMPDDLEQMMLDYINFYNYEVE